MKLGSGGLSSTSKVFKRSGQDTAHVILNVVKSGVAGGTLTYLIKEGSTTILTLAASNGKRNRGTFEVKKGLTYTWAVSYAGTGGEYHKTTIAGNVLPLVTNGTDASGTFTKMRNIRIHGTIRNATGGGGGG